MCVCDTSGQSPSEPAVQDGVGRGPQPQQQQRAPDAGSRLSNGALDPTDQDSATRVIDLQATLDKQVRSIRRREKAADPGYEARN